MKVTVTDSAKTKLMEQLKDRPGSHIRISLLGFG